MPQLPEGTCFKLVACHLERWRWSSASDDDLSSIQRNHTETELSHVCNVTWRIKFSCDVFPCLVNFQEEFRIVWHTWGLYQDSTYSTWIFVEHSCGTQTFIWCEGIFVVYALLKCENSWKHIVGCDAFQQNLCSLEFVYYCFLSLYKLFNWVKLKKKYNQLYYIKC